MGGDLLGQSLVVIADINKHLFICERCRNAMRNLLPCEAAKLKANGEWVESPSIQPSPFFNKRNKIRTPK